MPPMPTYRYPREDTLSATATQAAAAVINVANKPNAALIAGLVTGCAIVMFIAIVVIVPLLRRRRQRDPPPPTTIEQFLGKDSTFDRSNPNDIAAILDHLSYLPQNEGNPPKIPTPKRRSLLLGRRLSSQTPRPLSGHLQPKTADRQRPRSGNSYMNNRNSEVYYNASGGGYAWDSYYSKDSKDSYHGDSAPPLDEYAEKGDPYAVPASAPAAVSTSHKFSSTRPLNIRSRTGSYVPQAGAHRRHRGHSPGSDSDYSQSDSEDEYSHARGTPVQYRPASGKENRRSSVGERLKSRFSRDYSRPDSFSLAAAPASRRNRAPPLSKSSGLNSPAPAATPSKMVRTPMPLDSVPEIPNSSIAVGFALPDSPGDIVVVTPDQERFPPTSGRDYIPPVTPRNVQLPPTPRTPRTPGSPLREVFTAEPPRTPLREVLTPRTPRPDGYTPRREVFTPRRGEINSPNGIY